MKARTLQMEEQDGDRRDAPDSVEGGVSGYAVAGLRTGQYVAA